MKRNALGRGLSALIPEPREERAAPPSNSPSNTTPSSATKSNYFLCPIERIQPQKGQPRSHFDDQRMEELIASMREQGVLQPLIVRPLDSTTFEIVAGERRWRAAQKAGLRDLPVVIRDLDDLKAFELALVENIQRDDLNSIEEAEAYRRLVEQHNYTQDQVARRVGKDRSTITNALRLLHLPQAARFALLEGSISSGHARALLPLQEASVIERFVARIVEEGLSVRQTEALVKSHAVSPAQPTVVKKTPISANVRDLQEKLSRSLATRVILKQTSTTRGRIEVCYNSLDELDRLLERLI